MSQRLYRCTNCRSTRFHERQIFDIKPSDVLGVTKIDITTCYVCELCGVKNYQDDIAKAVEVRDERHHQAAPGESSP